ncbi:hypothetical protein U6A24_00785 [Aquimarina gracilis]|uniref:Uncharacterized protein n=1 Tax=Aquimarina gracilis TaxID=874422 RepID=A0ABU5ZPC2_9FLAO|nr:hypothetical protein [Aquimarina gracilis]MEB3343971.1 hypothetical protein [Aquimarina gracilis]
MKTKTLELKHWILPLLLGVILLFANCEREPLVEEELNVSNTEEEDVITKEKKKYLEEKGYDLINIDIDIIDIDWCSIVPNLSGYYYANDGGHYYVRHINNKIYWFGEHPSGIWANVFTGTISGKTITGDFYDVPKGRIAGSGSLTLRVGCFGSGFTKVSGNNFGGSVWTKAILPTNLPRPRSAGFGVRNDFNDITGKWIGNDGGHYYIRQIGNRVIWFGEHSFTSGRPAWANIAWGSRFYSQLWLDWIDVPKGNTNSAGGILRGFVEEPNYISLGHNTGGFGGSKLWR